MYSKAIAIPLQLVHWLRAATALTACPKSDLSPKATCACKSQCDDVVVELGPGQIRPVRSVGLTSKKVIPMQNATLPLFTESSAAAAFAQAIDELHAATAIYTSEPAVDQLLDKINWPNGDSSIADCSAGDSQFLVRSLTKLLSTCHVDDEKLPQLIRGWEIHPNAASQARTRLAAVLISFGRSAECANEVAKKIVRNQDFLIEGPNFPCINFLMGNSPYLRMVSVPPLLRDEYSHVVPKYAFLDLMFSFLDVTARV